MYKTTAQRCHVTQCPQEAPGLFKVARPKGVGTCTSRCPKNVSGMLRMPVLDWLFPPLSPQKLETRHPNLVNNLLMARLGHRLRSALRSRRACPPWPNLGLKKGPETSPFVSTMAENEGAARPAPNLERAKPGPCSPPPAQPPANRQLCSPWLAALADPPLSSIQPSKQTRS